MYACVMYATTLHYIIMYINKHARGDKKNDGTIPELRKVCCLTHFHTVSCTVIVHVAL